MSSLLIQRGGSDISSVQTTDTRVSCRYCFCPIDPRALKCPHCHELQIKASTQQSLFKRLVAALGIFTALLSLIFGLKEGYFYIQQQAQQRSLFTTYLNTADHFFKLDNLDYAELSLNKALAIEPANEQLRLRYFLLRGQNLLREVDYYGLQLPDEKLVIMPDLVTSGFSLVESALSDTQLAQVYITLGRLLQYDRRWESPMGIDELFRKANKLAPQDADAKYWYGEWLFENDETKAAYLLLQEAQTLEPNEAIYVTAFGRVQAERGDYALALVTLRRAIELKEQQQSLQSIRAANEAVGLLSSALVAADQQQPITGEAFFSLSMSERLSLIDLISQGTGKSDFRALAARLLHANGQHTEAEVLMRKVLGRYDSRSNVQHLMTLASILDAQNMQHEAQEIRSMINRKVEGALSEEIMEIGVDGKHRYKMGIKVTRSNDSSDAIKVLKVYQAYPFAKAGVKEGDELLSFAHRRIKSLRSITRLLLDFAPGTEIPITVKRANKDLNLSLVVE